VKTAKTILNPVCRHPRCTSAHIEGEKDERTWVAAGFDTPQGSCALAIDPFESGEIRVQTIPDYRNLDGSLARLAADLNHKLSCGNVAGAFSPNAGKRELRFVLVQRFFNLDFFCSQLLHRVIDDALFAHALALSEIECLRSKRLRSQRDSALFDLVTQHSDCGCMALN
jgi:hypothetical protein